MIDYKFLLDLNDEEFNDLFQKFLEYAAMKKAAGQPCENPYAGSWSDDFEDILGEGWKAMSGFNTQGCANLVYKKGETEISITKKDHSKKVETYNLEMSKDTTQPFKVHASFSVTDVDKQTALKTLSLYLEEE